MFKLSTRTKFLALFAALLATGSTLSGCYGSFGLTKKVYHFNGSLGNKWINSLFTFIAGWLVYGIAGTADVVIFNLIEFWTGSNPVAFNGKDFDQKAADGTRVQGHILDDGRLEVSLTPVSGESKVVVLDREIDGIKATTVDGAFVAKVATIADGRTVLLTPKAN
jgi:Domain of unknown function (DUF3332)